MMAERGYIKSYLGAVTLFVALFVAGSFNAQAWDYRYDSINDMGIWSINGSDRFKYGYTSQQWFTYAPHGGWVKLGKAGALPVARNDANPANFIGDGSPHPIGTINGVSWSYRLYLDSHGLWINNNLGIYQFWYRYGDEAWAHNGPKGGWQRLSYTPMSADFVGDGSRHTIGMVNWTLWSYELDESGYGLWRNLDLSGIAQFSYRYSDGVWFHQGRSDSNVRKRLSYWPSERPMSAAFVGDGKSYDIGQTNNGLGWHYSYKGDKGHAGWWHNDQLNFEQFFYDYPHGLWAHQGQAYPGWFWLGNQDQVTADFVGDGDPHPVGFFNLQVMQDVMVYRFKYDQSGTTGSWYDGWESDDSCLYARYQYDTGSLLVWPNLVNWSDGCVKSTGPPDLGWKP